MSMLLPALQAPLNFVVRTHQKPRVLMAADQAKANTPIGEYRSMVVNIADARALPEPPNLDREGFALLRHETAVCDFYDLKAIERVYYPEVIELLQRTTGATEVHIFDHTLRIEDEAKRRAHGTRRPVSIVHNDYTERSGPQRVRDVLAPEAADRFLSNRFAMVNVWRSFGASAERFPLAAADGRTVPRADYVTVDLIYPDRTGEIYQTAYSEAQRWYYFARMQRNEVMLLKCFDTANDERTPYTAHSGFANPHAPDDTPPRESIEVRTLLSFAPPALKLESN